MDPATEAQRGPLETRAYFLHFLSTLRVSTTNPCDDCEGPRSDQPLTDSLVRFECQHECSEQVARDWFYIRNFCRACLVPLFLEIPVGNDIMNIRRLWSLLMLRNHHADNPDRLIRGRVHRMWQTLLIARADYFLDGKVQVCKEDYGIYRESAKFPKCIGPGFPTTSRKIDAKVLVSKLEGLWEFLYMNASAAATSDQQQYPVQAKHDITKLQVPCHPLAVKLLHHMVEVIESLDNRNVTAAMFHGKLDAEFVRCEVYELWRALIRKEEAPQGFFVYQRNLVEAVKMKFLLFPNAPESRRPDDEEVEVEERGGILISG